MFAGYFGASVRPYSMVRVEEVADGGWGRADETPTLEKGLPPPAGAAGG
jgi:4-oxalocrotonate tautomerase